MRFLTQLFVNTALANMVLFGILSIWAMYLALRNRSLTPDYGLALALGEAALALLLVVQIGRWLIGAFTGRPTLSLIYGLLALLALPSVWLYTHEQSPRRVALIMALACSFTSGMVLRTLQTGMVGR